MMPFLALGLLLLPAAASDDGDLRDYTVPLGGGAELRMRTDAHLEAERPLVRHTAGEELVLDSAWGACDGDDDEGGGGCGHATGQTGRVVWPAAVLLLCTLQSHQQGWAGQHALELGSGTGIIGLALLKWGAASVVLTDLPHMLPTINANIAANPTSTAAGTIAARVLDWRSPPSDSAGWGSAEPFTRIVAADVIYAKDSVAPFLRTLAAVKWWYFLDLSLSVSLTQKVSPFQACEWSRAEGRGAVATVALQERGKGFLARYFRVHARRAGFRLTVRRCLPSGHTSALCRRRC